MNIINLYYFLDVVDTCSISTSARNLYISPQGLSQAIIAMEKEHKVTLFNRGKSGLKLSSQGVQFAENARLLLQAYESFLEKTQTLSSCSLQHDSMPIYTTALVSEVFRETFSAFFEEYSATQFQMFEYQPLAVIDAVRQKASEGIESIGIIGIPDFYLPKLEYYSDVCFNFVLETSMVVCVNSESYLAKKKIFSKQELISLPTACNNEPLIEECILFMLKDFGKPNIVQRSSPTMVWQSVLARDSIFYTVNITEHVLPDSITLIPIKDSLKSKIVLISDARVGLKTEEMLAFLCKHMEDTFSNHVINHT
jgi:DNA-binding transcriptional LysR family regulator